MSRSQRTLLIVLVVALLAVLAISALGGDDETGTASPGREPEVVTASRLSDFVAESGDNVYWIGLRRGASYELTETSAGRVFVRYLRGGAEAGDERADFVTVATYPAEDGVAELQQAAGGPGAELDRTADGALLLAEPSAAKSAHLAYPGADVQIEVYSPIPGHAQRLASRGEVRPVPSG